MANKDFITIREWSTEALNELLALADSVKDAPSKYAGALHHKALVMIFEKPSLRTRVSFDVGIQQHPSYVDGSEGHGGDRGRVTGFWRAKL